MLIQRIQAIAFRNLQPLDIQLSGGFTLLSGKNGQGKSNFLEALHFLTQGYSPRTRKNAETIPWSADQALIMLEGERQGLHHRHAIEINKNSHRIKINHEDSTLFSKLLGTFGITWIAPEDLDIVRGGPAERRRFFDGLFCQHSPLYLEALRRYQRVLKQRNAMLREPHLASSLWESYTHQWAVEAAQLSQLRRTLLDRIVEPFKSHYAWIADSAEKVHMVYRGLESPSDLVQAYWERAHLHREADLRDGTTHDGPQRDEILLLISGKPLRDYGSQGQCRSAALALKFAAAEMLKAEMQAPPVLLLDDVFAELDQYRQLALADLARSYPQVIAAAPDTGGIPFAPDAHFRVDSGLVQPA